MIAWRPERAFRLLRTLAGVACLALVLLPACRAPSTPGTGVLGVGAPSTVGTIALTLRQRLLLQLADGTRHELVAFQTAGIYPKYPRWSPDGRQLAYVLEHQFQPGGDWGDDIYTIDARGGAPRLLRKHGEVGRQVAGLAWTPDGRSLLFGDAPGRMEDVLRTGTWRILRMNVASHHETVLLPDAREPSLSQDGAWMAYLDSSGQQDAIGIAHADGTNTQRIMSAVAATNIRYPRIAPDGGTVAFTANTPLTAHGSPAATTWIGALMGVFQPAIAEAHGLPADVWQVAVTGGAVRRITNLSADDPCPAWAARPGTIVMVAAGGIYAVTADGSSVDRIGDGDLLAQLDIR